jgi:hypothetical protein
MSNIKESIDQANGQAVAAIIESQPNWIGCGNAIDVIPGMTKRTVLHAGPPIEWQRMCQAMRNGILGAILYEDLAKNLSDAEALIRSGEIILAPCHDHSAVGSMTGITSATMPVAIVLNERKGNLAYCGFHEGMRSMGFSWGNHDQETIDNMKWIRDEFSPTMDAGLRSSNGLDIYSLIARSIQMGDENHGRCKASTSLMTRELIPWLVKLDVSKNLLWRIFEFLRSTDMFALNIIMAAAKSIADSIKNIPYCSIITTMARNGVEFGIKVSALGERWFIGPAQKINTVYLSSTWNDDVATPDMGDSSIVEVIGLGGLIRVASPALGYSLGFDYSDSVRKTEEAYAFCAGEHKVWQLPALGYRGVPLGIDIRKVIKTGVSPTLDTATAHINGGKIGIGEAVAPMKAFETALLAFKKEM